MRVLIVLVLALLLGVGGMGALYALDPPRFVDAAVSLERWMSGMQLEEVVVDGQRIVYLDNHRVGETLVLVHGFGGDKDNWLRVARPLRSSYRVIALDLPGYGESDPAADGLYGIERQAQRLHAFIGALGLTRAHLGGHSMGGHVVAAYAARYPNAVGSLWLVANAGMRSAPRSELGEMLAEGGRNPLLARTLGEFGELLAFSMSQPPPLPQRVVDVLAARAIRHSALRERQFAELNATDAPALEDLIGGLPIPTHILWGDQDRCLHVGAVKVLQTLLPQASSTVMPGIGHVPLLEAPAEMAADYLRFRQGLGRGLTAPSAS